MRIAVIGTGPSAIHCTRALIARGYKPIILDVGETLDAERASLAARVRATKREDWSEGDIAKLSANPTIRSHSIPRKLLFGSNFVYGVDRAHSPLAIDRVAALPTFARGGYSTVWGGALMPMADGEYADWPIPHDEMKRHYAEVLQAIPWSGGDLVASGGFPAIDEGRHPLLRPRQAQHLMTRASSRRDQIAAAGFAFGGSRLAVRMFDRHDARHCIGCGLCLTGCPVGAIYSTADDLDAWRQSGQVEYRDRIVVRAVEQRGQRVAVTSLDLRRDAAETTEFDAVFLGSGPINSTRIMLRSMRRFSETVTLKTSQKFLLPMLTHARVRGASFDESLTLAALFAAAPVAMLGGRWTYLQITAINNWMLERLRVRRSSKMHSAAAPLFDRLMAGWCSLSSADSPEIAMTLRADASADLLHLAARDDPTIMSKARAAAARIAELGPMIGARFLNFGMRLAPVGDGSHVGGTMPMSHAPEGPMATDRFGRPTGFERLFVVDASIFPTIPATTVALTVMANAHRIGSTAPLEA